jgi:hypothetical protein
LLKIPVTVMVVREPNHHCRKLRMHIDRWRSRTVLCTKTSYSQHRSRLRSSRSMYHGSRTVRRQLVAARRPRR